MCSRRVILDILWIGESSVRFHVLCPISRKHCLTVSSILQKYLSSAIRFCLAINTSMGLVTFLLFHRFTVVNAAPTTEGADLTNTLLANLAPLLELFGQDMSTQFLSQSLGWADDIMFAMAPLGLITVVVGAIRVLGFSWLRAFIGRAREPRGEAEKELLSSTSHEVCELWSNDRVVRVLGSDPRINEVLVDETPGEENFYQLEEALKLDLVSCSKNFENVKESNPHRHSKRLEAWPPNLTLNLLYRAERRLPIQLGATLGVILQTIVLVVQGLITYRFQWKNGVEDIQAHAFPLACSGTVMLCAGMLACAHALQACTSEEKWSVNREIPPNQRSIYMLWLQKGNQVVSHQRFDAFALFTGASENESREIFSTAWRSYKEDNHDYRLQILVVVGMGLALAGWIAQFMGLSALHWSGVLVQLAATLIMAAARSVVRHRLSKHPKSYQSQSGF